MGLTDKMIIKGEHKLASGIGSARLTHRLKQLDKIKMNGVDDTVSMPQIAICGDQSSGKSSVLERLTGIPFPRGGNVCTRFPIEIIFRHTNAPQQITASIQPHPEQSPELQHTFKNYRRKLFDVSELPIAIGEVKSLLLGHSKASNNFAADVMRIEVLAPTSPHLTIVDLPGLIQGSNGEHTEEEGRDVEEMVERYLASPRTIILATLQAPEDVTDQRILQLARKHDPEGRRTVNILTKTDLISQGTQCIIAALAKKLEMATSSLGCFLLNPSIQTRDEIEFFSRPSWKQQYLDRNRMGVENLRQFLQELHEEMIECELPEVCGEIRDKLTEVEGELKLLGPERRTVSQIRSFLLNVSMRFYLLAQATYDGNYQGDMTDFFSDYNNRLRAKVHIGNGQFSDYMRDRGEKRKVIKELDRKSIDAQDTRDIHPKQLIVSASEMKEWVKDTYAGMRGRQLPGNHNHVFPAELFHEQSSRWSAIARDFTQDVDKAVSEWVVEAVAEVVREEQLRREIIIFCQNGLKEARRLAYDELERLIDEEKKQPMTYHHGYTNRLMKSQIEVSKKIVRPLVSDAVDSGWNASKFLLPNKAQQIEEVANRLQTNITVDIVDQVCQEGMAALDAYYTVAMRRFVDNVCRQVIERHFMSRLPSLLCPQTVADLSDEELLRIGSESRKQRNRRAQLTATIQSLRESLAELQRSPELL
ncbi:putative dynamin GTPase [Jackrogersella minutella]|nr:putative dynamin GTPase [Jackrogersella minutella]